MTREKICLTIKEVDGEFWIYIKVDEYNTVMYVYTELLNHQTESVPNTGDDFDRKKYKKLILTSNKEVKELIDKLDGMYGVEVKYIY